MLLALLEELELLDLNDAMHADEDGEEECGGCINLCGDGVVAGYGMRKEWSAASVLSRMWGGQW